MFTFCHQRLTLSFTHSLRQIQQYHQFSLLHFHSTISTYFPSYNHTLSAFNWERVLLACFVFASAFVCACACAYNHIKVYLCTWYIWLPYKAHLDTHTHPTKHNKTADRLTKQYAVPVFLLFGWLWKPCGNIYYTGETKPKPNKKKKYKHNHGYVCVCSPGCGHIEMWCVLFAFKVLFLSLSCFLMNLLNPSGKQPSKQTNECLRTYAPQ